MRVKPKEKHWAIGRHYARFVDDRWHPGFQLNAENLEIFIRVESSGRSSCTEEELKIAAPLFNGKVNRELTIKMIHEEMADWWSMGTGWFYPLAHTLHEEFWNHKQPKRDTVYLKALIKIMRSCYKDGFIETLLSFTGMAKDEKARYINRHIAQSTNV
jgi:hypothetical protein